MKNLLERLREARAARHENREAGFSLIELIVVIAIIGILIAIAIPVYGNIQNNAKVNQLKNTAATGASLWAATYAEESDSDAAIAAAAALTGDDATVTATGSDLTDFCVSAAPKGATAGAEESGAAFTATSGPGCP